MKPVRLIVALGFSLAIADCASHSDDLKPINRFEVAQNVCNFGRTVPNSITAVQTITGSVIYGSTVNEATATLPTVWSSIFATKSDALKKDASGIGFCCAWRGPYYYCGQQYCAREERHDVSALFGAGRAQNQDDAEQLAEDNCNKIVDQYKQANDIRYSSALRCTKLVTQQCF